MDDPARIARHLAMMEQRRREVAEQAARVLPPGARFVWELGCGHGHFLSAFAKAHPDMLCIGIDVAAERIERAVRKRERAGLVNLHFLRAEGRMFLELLPAGVVLADVFILFPDPWPKLRHHKHRIMQPGFLAALAARATHDCRILFRTDYRPYFADTLAVIASDPHWRLASEPWPFEFETVFQRRAPGYESLIARRRS